MAFVGGLVGASIGSAIAMLVFAPLTAVNNYLGSYYFGSGMILGEREMYQERWPQIKKELDKGRSFIEVLEEVMKESTQGVMNSAERTLTQIKPEWERIVKNYLATIPEQIVAALRTDITLEQLIALWTGGTVGQEPPPPIEPPDEPPGNDIIHYNIDKIESLSITELRQIIAFPQRYTESTVAHAKTVLASKEITDTATDTQTDINKEITNNFWRETAEFLKNLALVTFEDIKGQRTVLDTVASSTRTRSSASDAQLKVYRDAVLALTVQLNNAISANKSGANFTVELFRINVNKAHTRVWYWQLIYI